MARRLIAGASLGVLCLAVIGLGWFLRGIVQNKIDGLPESSPDLSVGPLLGRLLPVERRYLFAPSVGKVVEIAVRGGAEEVLQGDNLILLLDVNLAINLISLEEEIASLKRRLSILKELTRQANRERLDQPRLDSDLRELSLRLPQQRLELSKLQEQTGSDPARPGHYWIKAPVSGTVLNLHIREKLLDRLVRPNEPLLHIGNPHGEWEIELKVPQPQLGIILAAWAQDEDRELDADVWLPADPSRVYKGKLHRKDLAGEASPDPDSVLGSDPVIIALVRIEGPDLPEDARFPSHLHRGGAEVHVRIQTNPVR